MTKAKAGATVIVHIPYRLLEDARIAPQIRPRRMIEAFEEIGCRTFVVAGSYAQRKQQIRALQRAVKRGELAPSLVYSESAGWPNAFSDGGRSLNFGSDVRFLKFMARRRVPVALFYRDAHHRSQEFFRVPHLRKIRRALLFLLAKHDLRQYNRYVSMLYLPSAEMRRVVPEFRGTVGVLPPGGSRREREVATTAPPPLRLLYVGGLGNHYRFHALFDAVQQTENVSLVVCTRQGDWDRVGHEYQQYLAEDRVQIVHLAGDELESLFNQAHACILTTEPNPYWDFAVPVKLFEYIGNGMPILATANTLAGKYVTTHGLGWALPYDVDAIRECLVRLSSPAGAPDINATAQAVTSHAKTIGWDSRARQVLEELS